MSGAPYATEADLVAAFVSDLPRGWCCYHETAGWDLLLVQDETGIQVGVEAKLSLSLKVLDQALPKHWTETNGPDYRAVLVPRVGTQHFLAGLMRQIGVTIITASNYEKGWSVSRIEHHFQPDLPDESHTYGLSNWLPWLPAERCRLPDYVPDVEGGKPSPRALTDWKVKAIKLMVLLDRRGHVTRRDMKLLGISPTRWTAHHHGFLVADPIRGGYVRCDRTPDLRAQHPTNYAQIEADFDTWNPDAPKQEAAA